MVRQRTKSPTKMLLFRHNGIVKDLNQREINARDIGWDKKFGSFSSASVMHNVAMSGQQYSRGSMSLLNSAFMWFDSW